MKSSAARKKLESMKVLNGSKTIKPMMTLTSSSPVPSPHRKMFSSYDGTKKQVSEARERFHHTLHTLTGGAVGQLEMGEKEEEEEAKGDGANHLADLLSTKFGLASCPECHGRGVNPRAHSSSFGYSEEMAQNQLATIGGGARSSTSTTAASSTVDYSLSPDLPGLHHLLRSEVTLPGLIRREKAAVTASTNNSMAYVPKSNILIHPPPNRTTPYTKGPKEMPRRTKEWLYQQFTELRFTPTPTSESAHLHQPKLIALDRDLLQFTNLHTLNVSGHELTTLENLPPQIKVVHAYGNKITRANFGLSSASSSSLSSPSRSRHATSPSKSSTPSKSRSTVSFSPSSTVTSTANSTSTGIVPLPALSIPPSPSSPRLYPHLLHLGLGYNCLTSLSSLLSVASTLISLDVGYNCLIDLAAACHDLRQFQRLKTLVLAGNPIMLQKYYRAAIIDVFQSASSATTLETLDGFALNSHLLGSSSTSTSIPTSSSDAMSMASFDTSRSSLPSSSNPTTSRSDAFSARTSRSTSSTTSGATGVGGSSTTNHVAPSPTNNTSRKKKLTPLEIEAAQQAARDESLRLLELQRRADEEASQARLFRPTREHLEERSSITIVLNGTMRGLQDPRHEFEHKYGVTPIVEDKKGKRKSGSGLPSSSSNTNSSASSANNGSSSGSKKKSKNAPSVPPVSDVNPRDIGWFVTSTQVESLVPNTPQDTLHRQTTVRQRTRYYFELRLIDDSTSSSVREFATINWQDGTTLDLLANITSRHNLGTQRGNEQELIRTTLYDWETLTQAGVIQGPEPNPNPNSTADGANANGTVANSNSSAGASFPPGTPCLTHPNIGYACELSFNPTVGWRDLFVRGGVDLLFYRVDEVTTETTETLTVYPSEASLPGAGVGDGTANANSNSTNVTPVSSSRQSKSPNASNKKKAEKSGSKKGKKGSVESNYNRRTNTATEPGFYVDHPFYFLAHLCLICFLFLSFHSHSLLSVSKSYLLR